MDETKSIVMSRLCSCVMNMTVYTLGRRLTIYYEHETEESISGHFTQWQVERFRIVPGDEYIYVYDKGLLLYAVNVTADSPLAAMAELMNLLSVKF